MSPKARPPMPSDPSLTEGEKIAYILGWQIGDKIDQLIEVVKTSHETQLDLAQVKSEVTGLTRVGEDHEIRVRLLEVTATKNTLVSAMIGAVAAMIVVAVIGLLFGSIKPARSATPATAPTTAQVSP